MPPVRSQRRARAAQSSVKEPAGVNAQVNKLRQLLDAQLKKEAALSATEEDDVRSNLELSLEKGAQEIHKAEQELLQNPFEGDENLYNFTDEERLTIQTVREAVKNALEDPSDTTTTQLSKANKLLVRTFSKGAVNPKVKDWQPRKFRILDPKDPDFDPNYVSSSEDEYKVDMDKAGKDIELPVVQKP